VSLPTLAEHFQGAIGRTSSTIVATPRTALLSSFPPHSEDFMSDDHKKQLQSQFWNIANTLRGKMGADEVRDYILGFIFYKYLSERMHLFADDADRP